MFSWFNLVLAFAVLQGAFAAEQPHDVLILTNVNIVDTRYGSVQPNSTVVIRDGRIAAIARYAMIDESRHVRVVNGGGKYLIPGLWDMHVHTAGGPSTTWDEQIIYPLYLANGITGVRDMGGNPDLLRERRARISRGELAGPHILMAGPFLNGGKSDVQTIAVNHPSEARAAVEAVKRQGADFVKVLSNLSRESYFAVLEEAHKAHLNVVGHLPDGVSMKEASTAGQHSIEHMAGINLACSAKEDELRRRSLNDLAKNDLADYDRAGLESIDTYDSTKALTLFLQLADNITWQVPTLSWWQAEAARTERNGALDERLQYVPSSAQEKRQSLDAQHAPQSFAALQAVMRHYLALAGAMRHAGVPFLAGTDSPDIDLVPGFSLHDELELMVQAGFTNLEALQAATLNPAVFQKKLDDYGVVEKDRVADLVLIEGNPLDDIRNVRKIAAVIVGGQVLERRQLDRMLNNVADLARVEKVQQHAAGSPAIASAAKR